MSEFVWQVIIKDFLPTIAGLTVFDWFYIYKASIGEIDMSPWFQLVDILFVPVYRSFMTDLILLVASILYYFELPIYVYAGIVPLLYIIFVLPFYIINLDASFWDFMDVPFEPSTGDTY